MDKTERNFPMPEADAMTPDATTGGEAAPAWSPEENAAATSESPRSTPQPYEFAKHALLSTHELRKLRSDHEEFLAGLALRLSINFRMEFELELESLTTTTYRKFVGDLAQPTHLTLFKVEPWRGISVLDISPAFGLAMTDRLLGGPGEVAAEARELSEIEVALLDQVAQCITEEWCGQWHRGHELKPALLGHESDASYLRTSPPESATVVVKMKARLGQGTGQIQLAFPFVTLEPLMQQIRAELKPAAEAAAEARLPKQGPWNSMLSDMKIAVAAELALPQLPARAIPKLKVGDVLDMPADSVNHVQLCLGGLARFTGRLGTRDHHWAVEVTKVLKT